ncbi:hypothetical protein [Dyella mobilis]|uniref:Uncharacterized protein n=1 Tax=Dyella mobilis TaxID=1849582 RepID=A0ABS2KDX2_9GAMM|nr:hypothetical protein [Dyella mobilis]MBM7129376.1 hypothetical protein [Dyella mobilis]GLQ98671.1 hypothetical protein GCM10007863_30910 [Dyella mobilis]
MGLDAQVIAVGRFSQNVVSAMEYPAERYLGVEAGQTVVTNIFVAPQSSISYELANAFGVHALDLGRHHLDPERADLQKLESMFGEKDVAKFVLLQKNGFNFYYLPNA